MPLLLFAQLEDLEVTGSDYIKPAPLGNFRAVWEELPPESEREDDYGLGQRNNLQVGARVGQTAAGGVLVAQRYEACSPMC